MVTEIDKNTALVLIDLQHCILANPQLTLLPETLANVGLLVDAFRRAKLPVVVVNVNPAGAKWTTTRKEAKPPQQPPKENALEITPEVKTQHDDLFITKTTWNAFYDTSLHEELQKRKITGIVLAGVSTSVGVEGTARSAMEHGYNISFASDAMTDGVREAHDRSIRYLFPRMGEVDTTQNIIHAIPQPTNAR